MTDKTVPAQQRDQPTQAAPKFTVTERRELLDLINAHATAGRQSARASERPEVTTEQFQAKLRAEVIAYNNLLDWIFDRTEGAGL